MRRFTVKEVCGNVLDPETPFAIIFATKSAFRSYCKKYKAELSNVDKYLSQKYEDSAAETEAIYEVLESNSEVFGLLKDDIYVKSPHVGELYVDCVKADKEGRFIITVVGVDNEYRGEHAF